MMRENKINKRGKSRPKFYIRRLRIINGQVNLYQLMVLQEMKDNREKFSNSVVFA